MKLSLRVSWIVLVSIALCCTPNHETSKASASISETNRAEKLEPAEDLPKPLFSSESAVLLTVNFLDDETGIIGGSEEYLALTLDGGRTWKKVDIRKPVKGTRVGEYNLTKALLIAPHSIVVIGQLEEYGSAVFLSRDMGANWTFNEYPGLVLTGLGIESDRVWISGNGDTGGKIFQLDNLGRIRLVWHSEKRPLSDIDFSSRGVGIAVGRGGLLVSLDKGNTWTERRIPFNKNLVTVAVSETGKGVAFGIDGTILYSTDYGVSWSVGAQERPADVQKAAFATDEHVWVVEDKRVALYSFGSWKVYRSVPIAANDIAVIGDDVYVATQNRLYRFDR